MIQIVLHRSLSLVIACSDGMQWERGDTSHGWQDKARFLAAGTSFLSFCLHIVFAPSGAIEPAERGAAFLIFSLLSMLRETAARDEALVFSPLLR